MSTMQVLEFPDRRLRTVAKPVESFDEGLKLLTEDMLETMYEARGIGLAATQVDRHIRLLVTDTSDEGNRPRIYINPEITASDGTQEYEEGCLSIPEQFAEIERPEVVEVSWLGLDGEAHSQRFDGLWSTCVQHEIDHLNGKLFIDYLKPLKRQIITRRMTKLKREQARG